VRHLWQLADRKAQSQATAVVTRMTVNAAGSERTAAGDGT